MGLSWPMSTTHTSIGIIRAKVIALAVDDLERAKRFYSEIIGLEPEDEHDMDGAYQLGEAILLLKPRDEWYGKPTGDLNARITLEVEDSHITEKILQERSVTITDPVEDNDGYFLGSFLDSEGNKLWFCSNPNA